MEKHKPTLFLLTLCLTTNVSFACTVFLLNDEGNAFYFGNENTEKRGAQIWFIPGGADFHAGAYIGFDGAAETGVNSEGLAFDWVNQYDDRWEEEPDSRTVRGNYGQRMLEQWTTVEEAVAFCRKYPHPIFAKARLMIADKSGASAIVGVRGGKLFVERHQNNHGMGTGFGGKRFEDMRDILPKANITAGFELLERCFERGRTPTRYSNFFNLETGEVQIKHVNGSHVVSLEIHDELKLGPHYYVVENLDKPGGRSPLPLEISMHRFPVDAFEPLETQEPQLVEIARKVFLDLRQGRSPASGTIEFRNDLSSELESIRSELEPLGSLQNVSIVKSENQKNGRDILCRLEFSNALLLQRIQLDEKSRIKSMSTEAAEMKGLN